MAAAADSPRRMTVTQHFAELRAALIICLIAWTVGSLVAFILNPVILALLLHPLNVVLASHRSLTPTAVFTNPTEALTIPLKISVIAGTILASPILAWQTWIFVKPGLRPSERRLAAPFAAAAVLLFAVGSAFAYFVLPIGLAWLTTFMGSNAMYLPDINAYLSFLLLLIAIFGLTFELPLALVLLGLLGFISSKQLRQRRRFAYLAIVIGALVITPGADPFTPAVLALPLIVLFEASILVLNKAFHR